MITPPPVKPSGKRSDVLESVRSATARTGLGLASLLLCVGLVLSLASQPLASTVLAAAVACLLAVPLSGILALIADVSRRREWPYVRAGGLIVLLLIYSLVSKL